jgi:hypothetical protein
MNSIKFFIIYLSKILSSDKTSSTIYVAPSRLNKFYISVILAGSSYFTIRFNISNNVVTVSLHFGSLKPNFKNNMSFFEIEFISGSLSF